MGQPESRRWPPIQHLREGSRFPLADYSRLPNSSALYRPPWGEQSVTTREASTSKLVWTNRELINYRRHVLPSTLPAAALVT